MAQAGWEVGIDDVSNSTFGAPRTAEGFSPCGGKCPEDNRTGPILWLLRKVKRAGFQFDQTFNLFFTQFRRTRDCLVVRYISRILNILQNAVHELKWFISFELYEWRQYLVNHQHSFIYLYWTTTTASQWINFVCMKCEHKNKTMVQINLYFYCLFMLIQFIYRPIYIIYPMNVTVKFQLYNFFLIISINHIQRHVQMILLFSLKMYLQIRIMMRVGWFFIPLQFVM